MQFGDPYTQWAYVCPAYPGGLEATRVRAEPLDVQAEVVWTWFNANFEPFDPAGPWFGFAEAGGTGLAPFSPECRAADLILLEEFDRVAAPTVLEEAAKLFAGQAALWILKPSPPPATETRDVAMVRAALARLKEAAETPPPSGHNQGPPLTDPVPVAEIVEGVRQVEMALAVSEVEGKRSSKVVAVVEVGKHMLAGAMRQIGQELAKWGMSDVGHWLSMLHRYIADGLTLLGQWLSGG